MFTESKVIYILLEYNLSFTICADDTDIRPSAIIKLMYNIDNHKIYNTEQMPMLKWKKEVEKQAEI